MSPRKPTAIDRHVGKRLRLLRQINEVSLEKLAEIVDVAPQQIQKYEIGETRISASRIFELSKIFRVPIAWFYDDLEAAASAGVLSRITLPDRRRCRQRIGPRTSYRQYLSPPTTPRLPARQCTSSSISRLLSGARAAK